MLIATKLAEKIRIAMAKIGQKAKLETHQRLVKIMVTAEIRHRQLKEETGVKFQKKTVLKVLFLKRNVINHQLCQEKVTRLQTDHSEALARRRTRKCQY